ncbi:putative nucleic acid-binding protein [Alkalihalobacillus xiaoxiensis]|uniref:Nucleic acid-binding protein n=1 Tax=Shouchella xiaoxiensis TaxID=766895 RepID=A0ABS2SV78_9BACI|nr:hypothetical protein [Shouchella xiaoxiensis]MBM7839421.1 putative nucleic acid-binding protein [Shouchella xiaoxiensis]
MIKIYFNSNFTGFEDKERILLDTGILLALNNKYDAWHKTVSNLFEDHILGENDKSIFLFLNPLILNEVTFLAGKPFDNYVKKHPRKNLNIINPQKVIDCTVNGIKDLIEAEVLIVVDGNKDSTLKQISLYKELGSADASNAAIANELELNFLTVDGRLANQMIKNKAKLSNIKKVYTTISIHQTYK